MIWTSPVKHISHLPKQSTDHSIFWMYPVNNISLMMIIAHRNWFGCTHLPNQSTNETTSQSHLNQPINQSISPPLIPSTNQPDNQPILQSINQSTNQSTNQPINQRKRDLTVATKYVVRKRRNVGARLRHHRNNPSSINHIPGVVESWICFEVYRYCSLYGTSPGTGSLLVAYD